MKIIHVSPIFQGHNLYEISDIEATSLILRETDIIVVTRDVFMELLKVSIVTHDLSYDNYKPDNRDTEEQKISYILYGVWFALYFAEDMSNV